MPIEIIEISDEQQRTINKKMIAGNVLQRYMHEFLILNTETSDVLLIELIRLFDDSSVRYWRDDYFQKLSSEAQAKSRNQYEIAKKALLMIENWHYITNDRKLAHANIDFSGNKR